jgi:hypothetical protein
MIHRFKVALCILALVVPMFGCGKQIVYLKDVPVKYIAETPASKPGRGEKIYVAGATDDRVEAEDMYGQVLFVPEKGDAFNSAVTESIKDCLITYGYLVEDAKDAGAAQAGQGSPPRILYTSIDSLYCHRETGFWAITDIGQSKIKFKMTERGGAKPLWSDQVDKSAEVVSVMMATKGDTESAVNKAFAESMKAFEAAISSPDFRNALTSAPAAAAEPDVSGH